MTKLLKQSLLIGTATSAAVAGTTLYVVEKMKNGRDKDAIMQEIADRLNSLPNVHTIVTADHLEKEITNLVSDTSNEIDTMHQAIVKIIKEKVAESSKAAQDYVDANLAASNDLFKNELDKHSTVLNDQVDQISQGIVGDHDLNYYAEILDDSVSSSQFNILNTAVDALDTDLNNRIDELQTDLNTNKTELELIKGDLVDFKADASGEMFDLNTSVHDLKASLDAALTKVSTAGQNIDDLKREVGENNDEIDRLLTKASDSESNVNKLWVAINDAVNKIDTNTATIDDLKIAQDIFSESNAHLQNEIDHLIDLTNKVNTISQTHTAEIADIQKKLGAFQTQFEAYNTTLSELSGRFDNLVKRVEKNEDDIKILFTMIKNIDHDVDAHIKESLKYMVKTDATLHTLQVDLDTQKSTFEKSILLNSNSITSINTELAGLKTKVATIETKVKANEDEIANFQKGIKTINSTIATIIQDVDDLTLVVNNHDAELLGLDARVAMLEKNNGPAGTASEVIYSTKSNKLFNLQNRFFFPSDITDYKQIQILYLDGHAGRYGSWSFNVDQMGEVTGYAGGDRLHPNRSWFNIAVDYNHRTMWTSFYYTAGNASWSWHSNPAAIWVKQIVGIK